MKTELEILRDLKAGQATTGAVAEHLGVETGIAEAYLKQLAREGLVDSKPVAFLKVWFLTHDGLVRVLS